MKMLVVKPRPAVKLRKVVVVRLKVAVKQRLVCLSLRWSWNVISALLILQLQSKPSYFILFLLS